MTSDTIHCLRRWSSIIIMLQISFIRTLASNGWFWWHLTLNHFSQKWLVFNCQFNGLFWYFRTKKLSNYVKNIVNYKLCFKNILIPKEAYYFCMESFSLVKKMSEFIILDAIISELRSKPMLSFLRSYNFFFFFEII